MKVKNLLDNIIVAIDVGTTKICVLVAQLTPTGNLEILAIGKSPSKGLSKGVIVNVSEAVESIKSAVTEAELMLGKKIESAYVGISGSHIQAFNSQGMVAIKNKQINVYDIAAVIESAKAIPIAEGHKLLHVIPQYYVIDGQTRLQDPLGMHGLRLEVQVHIITGAIPSIQNLIKCCEMAGIQVEDIILEQIASAQSVLSEDERKLGVGILDIGGGTSDLAIYQNESVIHTKVIPIAGNIFTNDIATCLRTTIKSSEQAKKLISTQETGDTITLELIQGDQAQDFKVDDIKEIVEARAAELLMLVREEIDKNKLRSLITSGLVLTGGGSMLDGLTDLAQDIIQIPVRLGRPNIKSPFNETLDSPIYATGYGLLLYVLRKDKLRSVDYLTEPLITRIFWRMKSWVFDFF